MTAHISEAEYKNIVRRAEPFKEALQRPWNGYLAKRADKNQPAIVGFLRGLGFMVHHLHEVGSGMFDLLVEKHGLNILVEVKDGEKSPSARNFTPAQERFNFSWRGMRCVVTNETDCLRLSDQVNAIARKISAAGIELIVQGNLEQQYQPALY